MASEPFDYRHVRRSFGRAASGYAERAVLQHEVEARLLDRLDYITTPPTRILDVGSGPDSRVVGSNAVAK